MTNEPLNHKFLPHKGSEYYVSRHNGMTPPDQNGNTECCTHFKVGKVGAELVTEFREQGHDKRITKEVILRARQSIEKNNS
jgi:hypothetical protein